MSNNHDPLQPPSPLPANAADSQPIVTSETGAQPSSRHRRPNGQFAPGNNANPTGRPLSAINRATLLARSILAANADALTQKAIDEALKGNPRALKLCLERLVPQSQDSPVVFPLPERGSPPETINTAHNAVVQAIATGELTPEEAHTISLTLEGRRRSWETTELAERITKLEEDAAAASKH